jgi:hypothetical protein
MAHLTREQQVFVVLQLACFCTPTEIVRSVSEMFGVTINRQQAYKYSPTGNARLTERWRHLFAETRAAFIADAAIVGIAHRSYRLNQLQELLDKARRSGNDSLAAQLLQHAAREVGNAFTKLPEVARTVSLADAIKAARQMVEQDDQR